MKRMLSMLLLLTLAFGISSVSAQGGGYPSYGQFNLSDSLASYLKMSKSQIDPQRKTLLGLNYDWSDVVSQVSDIIGKIEGLLNDSKQTPLAIGGQVGALVQERVTITRDLFVKVIVTQNAQIAALTPAQRSLIVGLPEVARQAQAISGLAYEAMSANLIPTTRQVSDLGNYNGGCCGGSAESSGQSVTAGEAYLSQLALAFASDVSEERTRRALNAAQEVRKQRMLRQQQ